MLRLRSCGAWAYYDSLSESRRSEIDAKFVPQEPPPREEPVTPAEPAPKKGVMSMIAIARENRQMLASQSKSAIQEIHQNGIETRLAMKRGEPTVRFMVQTLGVRSFKGLAV